jgi:hypothetical protein
MRDVDNLLTKTTLKPKRQLSANFTSEVIMRIQKKRKSKAVSSAWIRFKRLPRAVAAVVALASVASVGGAAYAVVANWPTPNVTQTSRQQTPAGTHIVGIDTTNCKYFEGLDGSPIKPKTEKLYYEIKDTSKLTDPQVVDMVRAICEENISNNAVSSVIKQYEGDDTVGMLSTVQYVIDAISDNSITLTPNAHYNAALYTTKPHLTYTRFKEVKVYDGVQQIAYKDLKTGDYVKLIAQDTSGKSTETPEAGNPLNDPSNIVIRSIIKTPPLTASPDLFYTRLGSDFVRVEPCDHSPSGFCRAYEFSS